jgi:flagellar motor component MotA
MQALFKLVPVVLVATMLGTVAGYSLHNPPAEPFKACALTEKSVQKSAAQEPHRAAVWAEAGMDSSWKRWPSVTDF